MTVDTSSSDTSVLEAEVRLVTGDVVRGRVCSILDGYLVMEVGGATKVNVPCSALLRVGAAA